MKNEALDNTRYDLLVLGSGEAGKYLAWTLAKQGKRVAVVERRYIGGACPNIACLPSKNIIHSAKVAALLRNSERFGITKSNYQINMAGVREHKRRMVADLVEMHFRRYREAGVELVLGSGRFVGPKTIEVSLTAGGKCLLRGDKVVINTGTRATIEPIPGLVEAEPLTHVEALELDQHPEHLLILGGGYVGLEFAQAMRRLGTRVTLIERNERLVHREDLDVAEGLRDLFQDEGIAIILNAQIRRVEGKSGNGVQLHLVSGGIETVLAGSHLLVATGRTPNTQDLGLELAGVAVTEHGHIQVNERLESTAPDVWAVGDCAGSPYFTHVAFDDFRVVRDNLAGLQRVTTGRLVPFCMFTDPEFARIGLNEAEAIAKGIPYRLATLPMAAIPRVRTLAEPRGFMKALIDVKSDCLLGFSAFGTGVGEVVAAVQVAMMSGLSYQVMRDALFTHPTISEGLVFLFSSVPPKPAKSGPT